jgi:hypothetical protein
MNRFRIDDSFSVHSQGFAFIGEIIEGKVAAGMTFEVPEAGHRWRMQVKAVEFVLMAGGKEKIGLVVQDEGYLRGLGVGWTAELHSSGHRISRDDGLESAAAGERA